MATIRSGPVRDFQPDDASQLLDLMKALAKFEGYYQDFRVTESDLLKNGIGPSRAFRAFVAPTRHGSRLLGMAITYVIPWTYDLKPVLVLKELFVSREARNRQIGRRLLARVAAYAIELGASRVQWTVLRGNSSAMRFYNANGGTPDTVWQSWVLPGERCQQLANGYESIVLR